MCALLAESATLKKNFSLILRTLTFTWILVCLGVQRAGQLGEGVQERR
jgi:hypothetical protein